MNATASKELKRLAKALIPTGTSRVQRSGFVAVNPRSIKRRRAGQYFEIVYNIGQRPVYQRLKKAFNAVPRPQRRAWLKAQWSLLA